MIKLTRTRILQIFPDEAPFLHVDFEVDGTPWSVTDLDITWDYQQIMDYLSTQEADIARQIALQPSQDEYSKTLYLSADMLPQSAHYAQLVAVHPTDNLKAEVRRYFQGQWYDGIRCLVGLWVLMAYQNGDIQIGDYVWIYYTNDPRLGHEEEVVPIIIDKVVI